MEQPQVILVDKNDNELGTMEKMRAHETGQLHRAFSVFIFNHKGEILLQRRNPAKYHSGGLWSNTCCSHPYPGEDVKDAANRRLMEEMGMKAELDHLFSFVYKAELDNDLTEHELDHVFCGTTSDLPVLNEEEVVDFCFLTPEALKQEIKDRPDHYTEWLKICFNNLLNKMSYEKDNRRSVQ